MFPPIQQACGCACRDATESDLDAPIDRTPVAAAPRNPPMSAQMGGAVEACDANRFMPPRGLLAGRECVGAFDTLVSPRRYQRNE